MTGNLRILKPDDPDEPLEKYISQVNASTTSPLPYDRLMIYYRKKKMYSEELEIIEKGILTLKQFYSRQHKQTLGTRIKPAVKKLSDRISKVMGLHDKKGNELFLPDPIPRWMKRRETTLQKLTKTKKAAKKKPATSTKNPIASKKKATKSSRKTRSK